MFRRGLAVVAMLLLPPMTPFSRADRVNMFIFDRRTGGCGSNRAGCRFELRWLNRLLEEDDLFNPSESSTASSGLSLLLLLLECCRGELAPNKRMPRCCWPVGSVMAGCPGFTGMALLLLGRCERSDACMTGV